MRAEPDSVEKDDKPYSDDEGDAGAAWEQLPPEREFYASPYDPPVKALVQEIRDRELDVRPSFQRNQVWDVARKSKFVESILLNIPIPTLFFAEDDDKSKVVVDGQQRLLALKEFIDGRFELRSLEVLGLLNGKGFEGLTERQQRIINNRTLRCLVISAKSDSEIRFQVFERLNQGGLPLNSQEVRHCVYRGELNDLLHRLVKEKEWLRALGREVPHNRMIDCELVLRFFALRSSLPKYSPPLKTVLNEYMRDNRRLELESEADLRNAFMSALTAVRAAFPEHAFKRISPTKGDPEWDKGVNRAVFDTQMIMMEGVNPDWCTKNREALGRQFRGLCLGDEKFADSVSRATADRSRLETRLGRWTEAMAALGAVVPHAARSRVLQPKRK